MSCSPARLASNRRNAQESTGPKSAEGKAASRLNALRHGMAGAGDVLAPGEDARLVASRAAAFTREFGAVDEMGRILAHRAALLSVRMEKSADREMTAVAANMAEARAQFDEDRAEELEHWFEALETSDDPRPAIEELERSPEGVAYLADEWRTIQTDVGMGDQGAEAQAWLWLGGRGAESQANRNLHGQISSEIDRLDRLAGTMTGLIRQIAKARKDAGLLASFDPGREATLARRYEAAAERGMYRAIRAIADIRRARERELGSVEPIAPPPLQSPVSTEPGPTKTAPPPASLGSFRAEILANASPFSKAVLGMIESDLVAVEPRKKRPDLRKIAKKGR